MKIYILTCVSENKLVSCEAHKSEILAQSEMCCQVMDRRAELEIEGNPANCEVNDSSAACGNKEKGYIWNITENEL